MINLMEGSIAAQSGAAFRRFELRYGLFHAFVALGEATGKAHRPLDDAGCELQSAERPSVAVCNSNCELQIVSRSETE